MQAGDTEALVGEEVRPSDTSDMRREEQWRAALKVCSGAFIAGMAFSWTSPALPSIETEMELETNQISWIVSLVPVGGLAACVPSGQLMDSYGRRGTLVRMSVVFAIGWLFLAMNYSVYNLYLGRLLTGLSAGSFLVVIPTYVAEIAHDSLRGLLGGLIQVMITAGILVTFVLGAVLPWQMLSLVCFFATVVSGSLINSLTETPCFLLQIGEEGEAKKVLRSLRGPNYNGLKDELLEMQESICGDGKVDSGSVDFKDPEFYRPLIVSVGLMMNQQFSGVNNVIFYSSTIFKAAGSQLSQDLQSILVALSQMLASIAGIFFIDRFGRRSLLQASNAVVAVSLFLLGLYFRWSLVGGGAGYGWLPLFSCVSFVVGFSLALGPVPWLMMGELFPLRFRGSASGIASCVNWTSAFLVTKSFPASTAVLGLHGTFWSYALMVVFGAVFVQKCVPETRGKSLNQIAAYFSPVVHVA